MDKLRILKAMVSMRDVVTAAAESVDVVIDWNDAGPFERAKSVNPTETQDRISICLVLRPKLLF